MDVNEHNDIYNTELTMLCDFICNSTIQCCNTMTFVQIPNEFWCPSKLGESTSNANTTESRVFIHNNKYGHN